jgi:putative CRISPR-associated protein (TIGR02620 family)
MNAPVIITRHGGLVEWLKATRPELADAPILDTATPADVEGKDVYGVLPLHLAALAASVTVVEFTAAVVRGGMDLTAKQMAEAGAALRTFRVMEVR